MTDQVLFQNGIGSDQLRGVASCWLGFLVSLSFLKRPRKLCAKVLRFRASLSALFFFSFPSLALSVSAACRFSSTNTWTPADCS